MSIRDYKLDAGDNRTQLTRYGPDSNGNCQDSNPATYRTWAYDAADRSTNGGYLYDNLGRAVNLPDDDTSTGDGSGDMSLTYYVNDMVRTTTQTSTIYTYNLDVRLDRYRSYSATAGTTTVSHANHYSDDSDSPAWIDEGAWFYRPIRGLSGLSAIYTGSTAHIEWQVTNLHGDVAATKASGSSGLSSTYVTDEFGNSSTSSVPRYGYAGDAQRSGDNAGGLITMGVRSYNPTTGRFLSVDPVYGGNTNSYVYPSDPVNGADLDGRMRLTFGLGVYLNMWGYEVRAIALAVIAIGGGAVAVSCTLTSKLSNQILKTLATLACGAGGLSLSKLFKYIKEFYQGNWVDNNGCYQEKILPSIQRAKKVKVEKNCKG